eukprot:TRINITY_DN1115_c0_g1_i1.p1 TRINITY_DN1115_c0_g1~~TRINITY_DN1115_c0_g1_i1.p1  ORF type:complete len:314 (+),score=54.04 TRINITY_DN1115_c0_g1_i1:176-1117(+)
MELGLLQSTQVGSLFPDTLPTIVTVNDNDNLSTAFQTLIENNILSVPVWDIHRHRFSSFIDMVDIVSVCVNELTEDQILNDSDLTSLMERVASLQNKKVGELTNFSGRNPFYAVESTAPLHIAIKLMNKWGVHRIPVVDSEGSLISVLTQSQVVHWLSNHMYYFSDLISKTLEQLEIGTQTEVYSVSQHQRAIDAFNLIYEKKVSAVAVVDANGILVGNISVSDLKLIGYNAKLVSRLFYPIEEYLKVISANKNTHGHAFQGALSVQKGSTMGEVVHKLVSTRTHRVYVVDPEGKPIGVISNLEVLKAICSCR